jgi:hypothetical protein
VLLKRGQDHNAPQQVFRLFFFGKVPHGGVRAGLFGGKVSLETNDVTFLKYWGFSWEEFDFEPAQQREIRPSCMFGVRFSSNKIHNDQIEKIHTEQT